MKICRTSIIVCIVINFIGLLVAGLLLLIPNCYIATVFQNIFIGIFSSSFVVLITLIIEYCIIKKQIVGNLKIYCKDYLIEFANLLPKFFVVGNQSGVGIDLDNIKLELQTDNEIFKIVQKLKDIYDDMLFNFEGFYPFLKKGKNNLIVHQLFYYMSKLNKTILYFNFIYLKNNSEQFVLETLPEEKSKKEFKEMISSLFRVDGDYDSLRSTFDKVLEIYPGKKLENIDVNKCL